MRVRVRLGAETTMAGPGGVFGPGAVVELPEETAHAMAARGLVELLDVQGVEVAVAPEPDEQAVAPRQRRRRKG